MTLLTSPISPAWLVSMFTLSRTIMLLATCALAACLLAPAAALAAPAEEEYVLELPSPGNPGGEGNQASGGDSGERSGGVPAAAADSADDGGLPILLIVLAGTVIAGATIAIMRRQKT